MGAESEELVGGDELKSLPEVVEGDKLVRAWHALFSVVNASRRLDFFVEEKSSPAGSFKLPQNFGDLVNASLTSHKFEERRGVCLDDLDAVKLLSTSAHARVAPMRAQVP